MGSLRPEIRQALCCESDDTWRDLTKRLVAYATCLLRGKRWRCLSDGVPPYGHDANSLAQQAIQEIFDGSGWQPKGQPYSRDELIIELKRLVRNTIKNMGRRKENRLVSSEPDLVHKDEEIGAENFFNNFPGDFPQADGEISRKEAEERLRRFQDEVRRFLADDERSRGIFNCICDGVTKRDDQATQLQITPQEITNARKRLDRKLDRFAKAHPQYPLPFIMELKNA